jgi:hypothetical protein
MPREKRLLGEKNQGVTKSLFYKVVSSKIVGRKKLEEKTYEEIYEP